MAWISKNNYLSQAQMDNNAEIIWKNFKGSGGWSLYAVCAMLGNMVCESNINPGIWEGLVVNPSERGFGLVQWTPATKLIQWCNDRQLDYREGDSQLLRINAEVEANAQWFENWYAPNLGYPRQPPWTFAAWTKLTNRPLGDMVADWALYYEHPSESRLKQEIVKRSGYAEYYFTKWKDTEPEPPFIPDPPVEPPDPDPEPEPPVPDKPDPPEPRPPTVWRGGHLGIMYYGRRNKKYGI